MVVLINFLKFVLIPPFFGFECVLLDLKTKTILITLKSLKNGNYNLLPTISAYLKNNHKIIITIPKK